MVSKRHQIKKDLLIVIQNIVQYQSLFSLIEEIKKNNKWELDILLFEPKNDTLGFNNIATELKKTIDKSHLKYIKPLEKINDRHYKICLTPYPDMCKASFDYLLGYYYGSASSKPNPTFLPDFRTSFHGVFLHSSYDAELMSVYCKSYIVPNLRLKTKRNRKHNKDLKKVLLYLPTYGDVNDITKTSDFLKRLKNEYLVISKAHHGTTGLISEAKKKSDLERISDEFYESNSDINELFNRADLVLSDNSGAIFDAMYLKIPVCIAAGNINKRLGKINTLQSSLVDKNIIPYSDLSNFNDFKRAIEKTLSEKTLKLQKEESEKLFPNRTEKDTTSWIKILDLYLKDNINLDYINLHDYYLAYQTEKLENKNKEILKLHENISLINSDIKNKNELLKEYNEGKLYRLAKLVYKIERRVLNIWKNPKK